MPDDARKEVERTVADIGLVSRRHALLGLAGIAMVLATACTPFQKQQAQRRADDVFAVAQVRAKIAAVDPATISLVHVSYSRGQVTLSGDVNNAAERAKIVDAARSVGGVTRVIDLLRINPKAPTGGEIAADLALEARVKAAIARETGMNALRVHVSAHMGVVVLSGSVSSDALRTVILQTVRNVPGVRNLIDKVTVQR